MSLVYRDYDQAALDDQYTVTRDDIRPLRDAREARVVRASAEVRANQPRLLDFVYGIHPRHRIDYYPTGDDFAPLVVFIHGGYWRSRSKDQFAYLAPGFTGRGLNFAAVGYPLAPEVGLGDIVESCRRAIHWLLSYPRGLRFDPTRLHVIGHSAGGHLAAMMMATDWTRYGLPAETIKSVTCISGLYDLEPLRKVRPLAELGISARDVAGLSPVRLAPPLAGPVIVTVGGEETREFHRQAHDFAAAWRARGMAVETPVAPGHHHFNILDALTAADAPLHRAVHRAISRPGRRRAN